MASFFYPRQALGDEGGWDLAGTARRWGKLQNHVNWSVIIGHLWEIYRKSISEIIGYYRMFFRIFPIYDHW
jgi:hypothetical protein